VRPQFRFDVIHKADEYLRAACLKIISAFENRHKRGKRNRQIKWKLLKMRVQRAFLFTFFSEIWYPRIISCRMHKKISVYTHIYIYMCVCVQQYVLY